MSTLVRVILLALALILVASSGDRTGGPNDATCTQPKHGHKRICGTGCRYPPCL
jgi:hypothetical protein